MSFRSYWRRSVVAPASALGRRSRSESGASLIFILVIMVLLTTVVTALMTYAFSASKTLRNQRAGRTLRTSADAALDAGVAMVKVDKTLGVTTSRGSAR